MSFRLQEVIRLEALCKELYESQDAAARAEAEKALVSFQVGSPFNVKISLGMSIVYLEFLSHRTVQRAWGSVNACLIEATLHMPSFWPQPPSPSWSAGSSYLPPFSRQYLFETWKVICPMYLDTWIWPYHLWLVSPGPLEVWLSNKEETSGTMFSHIFGHNQSCPNLLSRWNWKPYYLIWLSQK